MVSENKRKDWNYPGLIMALIVIVILLAACEYRPSARFAPSPTLETETVTPTMFIPGSATPAPSQASTPTPMPSPPFTPTPWEPAGCQEPPEDYTLVKVNGMLFNQRTLAMLQHAANLYGGEIDITGQAITQGSYTEWVQESFSTHAGGGAVDLSVIRLETWTVLEDEIEPLLKALRIAGFAAWLRDLDELYPGSPIHIHAVAIGDKQLSPAAQEQVYGQYGYFAGFNGLPKNYGGPAPDRYGGPIVC